MLGSRRGAWEPGAVGRLGLVAASACGDRQWRQARAGWRTPGALAAIRSQVTAGQRWAGAGYLGASDAGLCAKPRALWRCLVPGQGGDAEQSEQGRRSWESGEELQSLGTGRGALPPPFPVSWLAALSAVRTLPVGSAQGEGCAAARVTQSRASLSLTH